MGAPAAPGVWTRTTSPKRSGTELLAGSNRSLAFRSSHEPIPEVVGAFEREHEQSYGHRPRGAPVELVSLRLRASAPRPRPALRAGARAARPTGPREVWFGDRRYTAPVVTRAMLGVAGASGLLLVEEYDTVIVVPPGARAWLDDQSNVHAMVEAAGNWCVHDRNHRETRSRQS